MGAPEKNLGFEFDDGCRLGCGCLTMLWCLFDCWYLDLSNKNSSDREFKEVWDRMAVHALFQDAVGVLVDHGQPIGSVAPECFTL